MYDFEALVGELLQSRPELNRDELMRLIEQKKQTVGAGYLTDQGALFLLAGELGVSLKKAETSSDMTIKDLYVGSNDVTVVARVLAVYPLSTYNRKEGGTGKYRRLVLFDDHYSVRLTVWDETAEEMVKRRVEVGAPVRVVSGYVKQGLDGKPNLNLGKRGRIEVVADEKVAAKLPSMAAVTEKLTRISEEKLFMVIECEVASEPRYSEFVRSDGSPGSLFQFTVKGESGKSEVRVVVWSPSVRPELKKGQKVLITNLKTRKSTSGEYELHGDAGTAVIPAQKMQPLELRVASVTGSLSGTILLAIDGKGKVWTVEKEKEVTELGTGDAIIVAPESEDGGRLHCRSKDSVKPIAGSSLPSLDALATKLKDAKDETSQVMVEVIALSHGTAEDVNLKDGTAVRKGELTVGDDTGEMKLVGWRELAGRVLGIQPGERLRVVGASPKINKMGTRVLQMSNLTVIERIRERG